MGYLCMFFAGFLAGIGYAWFQRRTIWDNVEIGCLHGCLIGFGALVAAVTTIVIVALRLNYWSHMAVLFGSFVGAVLLLWLCDYPGKRPNERSP